MTNQEKDCNDQCQFIRADLSTSKVSKDPFDSTTNNITKAAIRIHYPSKVEVNKEEYIYPLMHLFAECGGFASILVGFSVLDVVTAVYKKMA